MQIRPVNGGCDLEQVKDLFQEYFAWVANDLGFDLSYQGAQDELQSLPGAFSPPAGCLLIAEVDGRSAACGALRPLERGVCELKRMYVRPQYRGQGLGRGIGQELIHQARNRGYRLARLDTEVTLDVAQRLYTSLGFRVIPPYYEVPPDILRRSVFMEAVLDDVHGQSGARWT
jgi:putative acetyltransferase